MSKVLKALESFQDATKKLSKADACISQVIPFITTILERLEIARGSEDHGIITFKRALKDGMLERFEDIENREE